VTRHLPPTPKGIAEAAALLATGGLVAFPTETVFGLGADAANPEAVARLYAAKGRPSFNPLIAHIAHPADAAHFAHIDPSAQPLIERFWPGPLTIVAPVRDRALICDLARAGLESVGLRCPSHPVAQKLLAAFGRPVVAPSANRSGHVSPTTADHVLDDLEGRIDAVLDGPVPAVGIESTIVAMEQGRAVLLRPGGIARDALREFVAVLDVGPTDETAPQSPGRLASHYATRAPLRLDAVAANTSEAVLDFGGQLRGQGALRLDLSEAGDLTEAASRLYAALRRLDVSNPAAIAVAAIPRHGLGEAIIDRLKRAAAPR
jgi:L-threonylcarbamoyladenylate synthase